MSTNRLFPKGKLHLKNYDRDTILNIVLPRLKTVNTARVRYPKGRPKRGETRIQPPRNPQKQLQPVTGFPYGLTRWEIAELKRRYAAAAKEKCTICGRIQRHDSIVRLHGPDKCTQPKH